MVKLQPVHGFAAETTAAIIIHGASTLGVPVSTTHVISTSIMGVGGGFLLVRPAAGPTLALDFRESAPRSLTRADYDTAQAQGGDFDHQRRRRGVFTSIIFGDDSGIRELRNVRSVSWTRALSQDVADCTITLKNTELTPIGNAEEVSHTGDFDMPGYMTYNRGETDNPWGFTADTGWSGVLVPDRLIRTYEGYGSDPTVTGFVDGREIWVVPSD